MDPPLRAEPDPRAGDACPQCGGETFRLYPVAGKQVCRRCFEAAMQVSTQLRERLMGAGYTLEDAEDGALVVGWGGEWVELRMDAHGGLEVRGSRFLARAVRPLLAPPGDR